MEQIEINKKYEMVSPSLKCRTQAKKYFPWQTPSTLFLFAGAEVRRPGALNH